MVLCLRDIYSKYLNNTFGALPSCSLIKDCFKYIKRDLYHLTDKPLMNISILNEVEVNKMFCSFGKQKPIL